ncbi:Abi family protein [Streptococcus gordonii]|uniref:Abi family protein n=1 Tax=Streptococcus gordonii TaxID=1302 RepID=UPI0020009064|nr:Abi family protein [Streptococcus gordonii]
MIEHFEHKSYEEQIKLLESRSMCFGNEASRDKAINSLSIVSYYKIKEFAKPFAKITKNGTEKIINYQNTKFEIVISRYYQDKNLRLNLLHAIEDIEVALKTKIAYVLGKSDLNGYGYLNFSKWCNKEEYCKHYLKYSENKFRKNLLVELRESSNSEIDEKLKIDQSKYPPIWLAVNVLTFGQMVNMLELMSVRNLSKISNFFNCDNSELISWLKCINLVRNICAHNSNIIDFKFKTVPQLTDEWKNDLYELKPGVYSNRIALPFLIISYMMNKINPKYHFSDIVNSLDKLIKDDDTAKYYGFKSISTMESIKSKWNKKPRIRRRTR